MLPKRRGAKRWGAGLALGGGTAGLRRGGCGTEIWKVRDENGHEPAGLKTGLKTGLKFGEWPQTRGTENGTENGTEFGTEFVLGLKRDAGHKYKQTEPPPKSAKRGRHETPFRDPKNRGENGMEFERRFRVVA